MPDFIDGMENQNPETIKIIDHNNAIFISDSLIDEINTKLTKQKKHYSCLIYIHDNPYIVLSKNEVVEKTFNLSILAENAINIISFTSNTK